MTKKDHFKKFDDHTLAKHFLLAAYLKRWATILLGAANRPGKFKRIWFVDAFAGAGGDEHGRPGSPVIAGQIARDVNAAAFPSGIGKSTGMRVVAFEVDEGYFVRLAERMEPFTASAPAMAMLRNYSLDTKVEVIVGHFKQDPVLYFLDPFGVDGLSAAVLGRILEGEHNEVLALFHDEGAIRLAGKARAGAIDPAALAATAEAEALRARSLFGEEDDANRVASARDAAKRSAAGHKSNPDAARIMDVAYGGDWWRPIIDETPVDQRQEKAAELYERVLSECTARYILRFSVETSEGRRKYFLIHASKNKSAHAAMKEVMNRTRKHKGQADAELIGDFSSTTDIQGVVNAVAKNFAGRTVRWIDEEKLAGDTVQAFAINETRLWMHEREALQAALIEKGWVVSDEKRGKPAIPRTFTFPPAP